MDTIFALSSGAGVAGVAVIRISGDNAFAAAAKLIRQPVDPKYKRRLVTLIDPATDETLDQALMLVFQGPFSFTGEDVIEFHVHGSRAVINGLLEALVNIDGLRPAEAGEFTRRAFESGKMDLTEVEGLNDLLAAETAMQRTSALKQMGGELSRLYEGWRVELVGYLAHLEADIDFPDEELPDGVSAAVAPKIKDLKEKISIHLNDDRRGQALREGFRIVIMGEPNVGKSTLLNYLANSDVAIVSEEAGTTRDVIDIRLDLDGFAVRLMDTAGIRSVGVGAVEEEGIRRAEDRAEFADLRLILVKADEWPHIPDALAKWLNVDDFIIVTQLDLLEEKQVFHVEHNDQKVKNRNIFPISVKEKTGLNKLVQALTNRVRSVVGASEAPAFTRQRHQIALKDCVQALSRFENHIGGDAVLAAEEVRLASRALGRITGRVGVEDILDVIFSDFCIGK